MQGQADKRRNVLKTIMMIVGLAVFTGASVACFGLFSDRDRAAEPSCQGLSGQEKTDCEQAKAAKPR
jgi:hypothetical protein